jgi:hypothetical protein
MRPCRTPSTASPALRLDPPRLLLALLCVLPLLAPAAAGASPGAQESATAWSEAQEAFTAGRWSDAAAALDRVLARSPEIAHAHFLLGLSLLELERRGDASPVGQLRDPLDALRTAARLDPQTPQYALHLAKALLKEGDAASALDALSALEPRSLDPALRTPHVGLTASAASRLGDDERAVGVLQAAITDLDDAPVTTPLWRALGAIAAAGRPELAHHAHLRAFEHGGDAADAIRALEVAAVIAAEADGAERKAWSARAAEAAERLLDTEGEGAGHAVPPDLLAPGKSQARSPTDPHLSTSRLSVDAIRLIAGRLRLQAEQPALAEPLFALAESGSPTDADPPYERARCALALADEEAALGHLARSLERAATPEQERRAWALRARILHRQGLLRAAADAYTRAGEPEQAELLEQAADAADEEEDRRQRCARLAAEVQETLEEAAGVAGPADLAGLRRRADRRLSDAGCEPLPTP